MPLFLIHYDLPQKPDVEYPELIPILTRLGATRISATAWALKTDRSITEIRDEIVICALPGDRFVVAQLADWRSLGTLARLDEL
jgi:hypothetical protein